MTPRLLAVDAKVRGHRAWLERIELSDTDVLVLEAGHDGLRQLLRQVQSSAAPYRSLLLVCHGGEARPELGATTLTGATVERHHAALTELDQGLAEGADILLYSRDLAAGRQGEQFVEQLAQATGAKVAASVDKTGPEALGGNGALAFRVGSTAEPGVSVEGLGEVLGSNGSPTFVMAGTDKLTTAISTAGDYGLSVTLQPDGKILVAGSAWNHRGLARRLFARTLPLRMTPAFPRPRPDRGVLLDRARARARGAQPGTGAVSTTRWRAQSA